jgi:hypothetical protein
MPEQKRELYSSPNGDKWFLSRDPLPTRSSAVESLRHEPQKTKVRERRGGPDCPSGDSAVLPPRPAALDPSVAQGHLINTAATSVDFEPPSNLIEPGPHQIGDKAKIVALPD